MPILNYTTQIDEGKSVSQIYAILGKHGASKIMTEYAQGKVEAVTFQVVEGQPISFRLPCNVDGVYKALRNSKGVPGSKQTPEQARRVAWRILKDWLEAQLALIESRQATLTQVMLPYAIQHDGRTVYELFMDNHRRQLPPSQE